MLCICFVDISEYMCVYGHMTITSTYLNQCDYDVVHILFSLLLCNLAVCDVQLKL